MAAGLYWQLNALILRWFSADGYRRRALHIVMPVVLMQVLRRRALASQGQAGLYRLLTRR